MRKQETTTSVSFACQVLFGCWCKTFDPRPKEKVCDRLVEMIVTRTSSLRRSKPSLTTTTEERLQMRSLDRKYVYVFIVSCCICISNKVYTFFFEHTSSSVWIIAIVEAIYYIQALNLPVTFSSAFLYLISLNLSFTLLPMLNQQLS